MAIVKKLGWSGYAKIDGVQVLVSSGNYAIENNPSYINMASIAPREVSRSRVLYADGTKISNGSIAFDITVNSLVLLSVDRLLKRRRSFDVLLNDGEKGYKLATCYATSVSITGSVGGLLNATVSFVSKNEYTLDAEAGSLVSDEEPFGYWYSGSADAKVREWSFNFSQDVQPMYLNQSSSTGVQRQLPKYLRVGLIDAGLEVTTFEEVNELNNIHVATRHLTLTGVTKSKGFSFNGQTDLGTYSHSFETAADLNIGPTQTIIS